MCEIVRNTVFIWPSRPTFKALHLTQAALYPDLKGMVGPKLETGATGAKAESWAWKRKHRSSQTKVPKGAKLTATIALEKNDKVQILGLALEHYAWAIGSTCAETRNMDTINNI